MISHPLLHLNDGSSVTSPQLQGEVRELQHVLAKYGFTVHDSGQFDAETERSVKQFQRVHGLSDDGVVGPKTWLLLVGRDILNLDDPLPTSFPSDDTDMGRENQEAAGYEQAIIRASLRFKIRPCIIAGIGSRESRWGLALRPPGPGGTGDFAPRSNHTPNRPESLPPDNRGYGRGLMQIDYDAHDFARGDRWGDPDENIAYGCSVLAQSALYVRQNSDLRGWDLVRAALAGYNGGPGRAVEAYKAGRDVDSCTTGRNYAGNVLDRAGWFLQNGWA